MAVLTISGKELKLSATIGVAARHTELDIHTFLDIIVELLERHPVDMYVMENRGDYMIIRSAGYFLDGREATEEFPINLDEKTLLYRIPKTEGLLKDKLWFKIEDYNTHFVGLFLFPYEY